MATVASGLNSGSGFNSSDTITSTTLNNHVNNATVTGIVNADVASNAAIAFTKLAPITSQKVIGSIGSGNAEIDIVGTNGILKNDDALGTSDTQGATQGNIKAYVDTEVANFPVTTPTGTTMSTSGTVTLPGGLIMKFGSSESTADGDETFDFPSAFSNNCFGVYITRTGSGTEHILPVTAKSTSSFTINRINTIDGNQSFDFLAIGN